MLEVQDLSYSVGEKQILSDVSATFQPGKLSMIIGPNGSGKTTLLRIMSNEIQPLTGTVTYHAASYDPKQRLATARIRAVLAQHSELSFPLLVEEVVLMGRYPHFSLKPSRHDIEICNAALERVQSSHLLGRNYLTLSGGERQMVHFARVLAQIWEKKESNCRFLLLDEPITSLDINHQHHFLNIAKSFASDGDVVVAIIHDVHLVAQYADFIIALKEGRKIVEGSKEEIIRPEILTNLYNIQSKVVETEVGRVPIFSLQ